MFLTSSTSRRETKCVCMHMCVYVCVKSFFLHISRSQTVSVSEAQHEHNINPQAQSYVPLLKAEKRVTSRLDRMCGVVMIIRI